MLERIGNVLKRNIYLELVISCSIAILLCMASKKLGFASDEYYTYGLSNYENGLVLAWNDGIKTEAEEVYRDYFTPKGLDLKLIWNNQKNDVHPPLYYLLFQIFELITNNCWGLKTGILFNLIFHICNIILLYKILRRVCNKEYSVGVGMILYSLNPVVLDSVLFMRMYVLLTSFILLLTLHFVSGWNKSAGERKFYPYLGLISIGGVLTHYYFVVYLFFCCCVWGVKLITEREWKELKKFLITMATAAGGSVAIFPYMIVHIFFGYRGTQSFDKLLESDWGSSLIYYCKRIDKLFGEMLLGLLIVCVLIFVYRKVVWPEKEKKGSGVWKIIWIPCVLYFLTISKIVVMQTSRYMSPLYAIAIILLAGGIEAVTKLLKDEKVRCVAAICLVGFMVNNSWKAYNWTGLYEKMQGTLDIASEYGRNNECIYFYETAWKGVSNYLDFSEYQKISFISVDNLDILLNQEYQEYEHVVLYFESQLDESKFEEIMQKFLDVNPSLNNYEKIYKQEYLTAYYLE